MVTSDSAPPPSGSPVRSLKSNSSSSSSPKSQLTLDLTDLPTLIQPSPPSNTLLITNLDNPDIFHAENILQLRDTIDQHASIHTWSPLRSFRRIIVSFYDTAAATLIKQTLDGETIMDCRVRVYFGAPTELAPTNMHLEAPKIDKLFFISPPPSPPHDWEIRNEDPPNKDVHAEDLAEALSRLHARGHDEEAHDTDMAGIDYTAPRQVATTRSRSATLVYHPDQHGSNPGLPAISVEDTSEDFDSPVNGFSPMDGIMKSSFQHTTRPPVELMH